ncbi:response regulator transcription factor [Pseudomonas sp. NyZ704]|nr:response regulator transcription factor [Pseudomonas sp. NyZ704]
MNKNVANTTSHVTSVSLALLTSNALLNSSLQQHLHELSDCNLITCSLVESSLAEVHLILLDVDSFSSEQCLSILKRFANTPIALINANHDVARQLTEQHPWIKGVFQRSTSRQNFVAGVRALLAGGDWLPRALMEQLVQRYRNMAHTPDVIADLSSREKQILVLAGKGLSNIDIANAIHLSVHTIKSHIHNALRKLGATNRAQGAALVVRHLDEHEK